VCSFAQDWAPVLAAVASAASAAAAWRTAVKTTKAAETSEMALAQVIRPTFSMRIGGMGDNKNAHLALRFTNTGAYDALDVQIHVRDSKQQVLQVAGIPRMRGMQPNVLGGEKSETLFIPEPPQLGVAGESYHVAATVRYSDERGIRRWEQELKHTWEIVQVGESQELKKHLYLNDPRLYPIEGKRKRASNG
jgi:hypothetical protein